MAVGSFELERGRVRSKVSPMNGVPLKDRLRLFGFLARSEAREAVASLSASPLLRWRHAQGRAEKLLVAPQDLHTADPTFAADVLGGRFVFAGISVDAGALSPFSLAAPSAGWAHELHGFGWLRHMRAANSSVARAQATALVGDWISICPIGDLPAWRPQTIARRLISWLSHSPIILEQADHAFYRRFVRSIAYQSRFLRATSGHLPDGVPRLTAAAALAFVGLCMSGQNGFLRHATRRLEDEINRQVMLDGGPLNRDPSAILGLLLDFLPLRQTYLSRSIQPPEALTTAIERMMPMLRFFRLGDGEVANFNGARPFFPDTLGTVLAYDDARGRPVMNARHSGYQRIEAGDTVVVMDAGTPPPLGLSARAHAGCLSFEMSAGASRIIVNCGVTRSPSPKWAMISRQTAAHSTATIAGESSCQFVEAEGLRERIGDLIVTGPRDVPIKRSDTPEGTTIDASHDGYLSRFGLIHQRRIVLDKAGSCLQGEDRFVARHQTPASERGRFALRFHLHPTIRAASLDARRALLILPNGEGWVFSGFDSPIAVEESVYLPDATGPVRTSQIVFDGRWSVVPSVSWEIRRVRSAEEIVELLDRLEAISAEKAAESALRYADDDETDGDEDNAQG